MLPRMVSKVLIPQRMQNYKEAAQIYPLSNRIVPAELFIVTALYARKNTSPGNDANYYHVSMLSTLTVFFSG